MTESKDIFVGEWRPPEYHASDLPADLTARELAILMGLQFSDERLSYAGSKCVVDHVKTQAAKRRGDLK